MDNKTDSKNMQPASNSILVKIRNVFQGKDLPEAKSQSTKVAVASNENLEGWLRSEAQKMDTKSYDTAQEEIKLRMQAQAFTPADIQMLKSTALNIDKTANERILSVYLLSMSTEIGLSALQDIASADVSNPGPHEPHSLGETQDMHEKALRRMALDELFSRAQRDPSYVPELSRIIDQITIPELKSYARERFQQLFG